MHVLRLLRYLSSKFIDSGCKKKELRTFFSYTLFSEKSYGPITRTTQI